MRAWRVGPVPSLVQLEEAKWNANISRDVDDYDLLIQHFIDAAVSYTHLTLPTILLV